MANRHLSRSIALQSLFEWDFHGLPEAKLAAIIERNIAEFAPGLEDSSFIEALVRGVVEKQTQLDIIIKKAAPDWPLEKIAPVDRAILRLGLYELLCADKREVPARVAINEAIEMAKTFGGDSSGKFVNGVLGTVYKEMGEPGKDEAPKKQRRPKEVPYAEMPIEKLGGAVVYNRAPDGITLALVHDIFGYWTLSKGHIGDDEDLRIATAREVKEELSVDVEVTDDLGQNEYVASHPEKGKIRKQVHYFLAETKHKDDLKLTKQEGLDDARWFPLSDITSLKMYDDILPIVTRAAKCLMGRAT